MPPTQKLDRNSQRPLYDQLGEVISKEIDRGLRKEGDRIPSVRQLAETYSVSLFTAHRTITNLVSQGMLQPERGRGTFVASTRPRNTTPAKAARTIAFRPSYSLKTMEDSAFFSRLLHGLFAGFSLHHSENGRSRPASHAGFADRSKCDVRCRRAVV